MAMPSPISYTDERGRARELVLFPGAFGSLLVVDRDSRTLRDRRLVAHIAADEPSDNAALVCRLYLGERRVRQCRPVCPEDFRRAPVSSPEPRQAAALPTSAKEPVLHEGHVYDIRPQASLAEQPPELRWTRRAAGRPSGPWTPVTLREALAALESYEPMRTLTTSAIARHESDPAVSLDALRRELARVQQSALVLNRGLREAVLDAVEKRRVVSMGELALRCGMVKRDRRGLHVGDTTWLARRIGLLPEGGKRKPTRWVHSDVLALIARHGLGVGPREVELE